MKLEHNGSDTRLANGIKVAVLATMIVLIADIADPSLLTRNTSTEAAAAVAAAPAPAATTSDDYFPSHFGPPNDPTNGEDPPAPTF